MIFDLYTWSVIIFAIILAVYVYFDRRKFERQSIVLLRRTQRGKSSIIRLGTKYRRFFKHLGTIGVIVGFAASIFVIYTLIENIAKSLSTPATAGLAFVLPSPSATPIMAPGVLAVPFWYWIIAIALLVIVHEGLHGIMSVMEKIKIKSLGWGLLAVIPLAFVEPDEKKLQKKSFMSQQRVFAAGSFANFLLAGVSILILTVAFSGIFAVQGAGFQYLITDLPAAEANLTGVIVGINDHQISNAKDLTNVLSKIGPDQDVEIHTKIPTETSIEDKIYKIKTVSDPDNETNDRGFIGISKVGDAKLLRPDLIPYVGFIDFSHGLLFFLFLINLGVGLANLLPIKPLDGGRMWEIVFQRISKKHARKITHSVGWVTLLLIIMNFVIPNLKF